MCSLFSRSVLFRIHIQLTLVISTSLISSNRLSRSEILIPVLTWRSKNRQQNIVEKTISPLFHNICPPPFRRKVEGYCFWFSVGRGVWCVARGAWCVVRGARCVVRGARCVVRGSEFLVGTLSP